MQQNLDLSDDEAAALATLLTRTIDSDRYPFPERIRTLKVIRAKLPAGACPQALAAAEGLCAAPSNGRPKTPRRAIGTYASWINL
jgi:hypothetical protein